MERAGERRRELGHGRDTQQGPAPLWSLDPYLPLLGVGAGTLGSLGMCWRLKQGAGAYVLPLIHSPL